MDVNSLARSDVFFIITTVAVITITVIVVVGLLYVITILRTVKRISRKAEVFTDALVEDLTQLRDDIKRHGLRLATLIGFFKGLGRKKVSKAKNN